MKTTLLTKHIKLGFTAAFASVVLTCAYADVQTAGSLYINVDATASPVGLANGITNSGSLGGVFDNTNAVSLASVSNVNAIQFSGYFLWLTNRSAGGLIQPASGMVGNNPLGSIEVWALSWAVPSDQSMISWGARSAGANVAFEYGSGGSGGMSHNGSGNDGGWDFYGGYPAPGLWHHLVYTSDGVRSYLYSDGVLVNSFPPTSSLNITKSASVLLGAQWDSTGNTVSTTPAFATLALARIRVHSGTLTPAQILNNYNFEKASFPPPPVTVAFLSTGPLHRYSFSEPATNDASGLTFHDSVGTAHGTVQASSSLVPPQFTGRRLVLNGDISTTGGGYGNAYGDLPNGLVSTNSTINGGSGELSIEIWYKNNDGISWSWSRLFDIGSCGPTTPFPALGQEVTGPGGYPSPGNFLDSFYLTAQDGNSVGQRQAAWLNKDNLPLVGGNYSGTNNGQPTVTIYAVGNYQTDRHVAVTWKESTSLVQVFDNGYLAGTFYVSNSMATLNDVNVWLGRSLNNDNGFGGEYDEVRFYNYVLTPGQVLGDFQVGPNTVNTGPQAAGIITQPASQSVNQGWPVTFYITAKGSPAVAYQWNRNGSPIPGATTDTYTISAASSTNNGDIYLCAFTNNTGSQTSTFASLTVVPNVASQPAILHETKSANPSGSGNGIRDNYSGTVGTSFQVGPAGTVVTHLGYYDVNGDGLNQDHLVSIYPLAGTNPVTAVVVPAGTGGFLTNFYRYMALTNPIALAPNAKYILQAEVYSGDGDSWADLWQPGAWNPAFVGNYDRFTRAGQYGSSGAPAGGANGNNNAYGAPNLAVFPMGPPMILAQQAGVTQYVGVSATLSVAANGQAPMTCQWYKAGSPNTPMTNQTALTLLFNSAQVSDEGNYYAVVSNALGTAQSANIYLHLLPASPVAITLQPTNVTVLQGYPASFYIAASGSPPIGYQWYRNNVLISGATGTSYTLAAAGLANNNDTYSCVVSNFTGSPHTQASANAILTVTPNQAPVPQTLYSTTVPGTRDNYAGMVGAIIQIGATPAKVTHLGYYLINPSLNLPHHVDIFSADGSTIVAEVFVSGTGDTNYNNYAYVALTNPVTLAANTSYILAAEVYSGSGDPWPDVLVPSPWNPYYVGSNGSSTRGARYGGNYPAAPSGTSSADGIYAAPNMALLPAGPTVVTMDVTNVTQYATSNVTFTTFVNGQPPVTVQWYKVGSPNTPLSGQTSPTLLLTNVQATDAGTYYLGATGPQGTAQGPNATLTVLPASPPNIILQPQSQSAYLHQQVTFTVGSTVPPQSYQWWFNGNPISGANASAYTVTNIDSTKAGGYAAVLTNAFGAKTSQVAVLTFLKVPAGSYAATVLNLNPLVYYPFQDLSNSIATGTSNVFNIGSLGTLATGLAEGSAASGPGPQPPLWPNFGATNQALFLDPTALNGDVKIPALNLDPSVGPNMTLVAWINPSGPERSFAGIIFNRGSAQGASGLGIKKDPNPPGDDMLEYHWADNYYTFNSGLYTTNYGNWAFVALAVDPSQAVFYLNDGTGMQTAVNVASHAGVSFASPTYVGWDSNDATRRYGGLIDEPMIFNRTLSSAEINQLYAVGIVGPVSLTISLSRTNVILTWPAGILQHASQVTGQYSDMLGVTSPATNPAAGYYRVRQSVP